MEPEIRHYHTADVNMLTVTEVLIANAIANQSLLVVRRPGYTIPFFTAINLRIENAFTNILGLDKLGPQRRATIALYAYETQAMEELALFKLEVSEDFKHLPIRRDEILNELGFTTYLHAAQNKNTEALVQLLFRFHLNMTPALQAEIIAAGTGIDVITDLLAIATILHAAGVTQETAKTAKKVITQADIVVMNRIYDDVISVAKISAKILKNNPAVGQIFVFAKILASMHHHVDPIPAPPIPAPIPPTPSNPA